MGKPAKRAGLELNSSTRIMISSIFTQASSGNIVKQYIIRARFWKKVLWIFNYKVMKDYLEYKGYLGKRKLQCEEQGFLNGKLGRNASAGPGHLF